MVVPTDIRGNIDYVFALKELSMANRRRLYEFFFGMFNTFGDFDRVFSACTRNFGALVLDKTVNANSVQDCVRYYIATPILPEFKLGRQVYFEMSDYIDEEDKQYKKQRVLGDMQVKVI
jgi:hypothetical protein